MPSTLVAVDAVVGAPSTVKSLGQNRPERVGGEDGVPCSRRPLGDARAVAAARAGEAEGRSAAGARPRGARGHPVRFADGRPVARGAARARLLRQDLPAPAAGVARGRGVGSPAPRLAGAPARRRAARLGPCRAGPGWTAPACRRKRGEATGPNPTDRGKPGTERHRVVDGRGTPLGVVLSGANRHDSRVLTATLDAVPGVRDGKPGRPRRRPTKLHADKGCDHRRCRRECRERGIQPRIARRGVESSERLGRRR